MNYLNKKYKIELYEDKIINLILYQLKEMNYCEIYWVGMLPKIYEYSDLIQLEIFDFLQNKNIILVLPEKNDFDNFQIYINKILHPIYNDLTINLNSNSMIHLDDYYNSYLNINKNFADSLISSPDKTPKMILINDIDLALMPNFLLKDMGRYKNLKKAQIENNKNIGFNSTCFIFNQNIPDFSILSLLQKNKDLIKSILLCDCIAFHSFFQAKNFLDIIKLYFNANYKLGINREIIIDYSKRDIPIFIRDIHIKLKSIGKIKNFYDKLELNKNKENNKIINIISIDNINNVNDILIKLNICFDLNKNKYLGFNYKFEIIVEESINDNSSNEENEENKKIVNEAFMSLKDKYGPDFNYLLNIKFVELISPLEQIKYFLNADIFLFSNNSIFNGMKPLILEFIIAQNELIINKIKKIFGLIVSDKIKIPKDLGLIKSVNFYEFNSLKNALKEIIEIDSESLHKIIQNDCQQIQKCSSIVWIKEIFKQIKKAFINNRINEKIFQGYGIDFSYYLIPNSLSKLNKNTFQKILQDSSNRLFLINIKSIFQKVGNEKINNLENINNNSNVSNYNGDNNKEIINLLNKLSIDKNNIICLFTNESKEVLNEININKNNYYLIAEDGLVIKAKGKQTFENQLSIEDNWKIPVIKLIKSFINKTGAGKIIIKEYSVLWNYTNEDKSNFLLVNELKFLLENFIDNKKYDIIKDDNYLEVKIKINNSMKYKYVNEILNENADIQLVFSLNNGDKSGDEFFNYLYKKEKEINEKNQIIKIITTIIGKKNSKASYYIKDLQDFINLFHMKD